MKKETKENIIGYIVFLIFAFWFCLFFSSPSEANYKNSEEAYSSLMDLEEIERELLLESFVPFYGLSCPEDISHDLGVLREEKKIIIEEFFFQENKKNSCGKVRKKGWSEEESYWLQYAYELSSCDQEFLVMLNGENGMIDFKKKALGSERSWGFCMIHEPSHPEIVHDPRFFTSQEWQLEKCLELWRRGEAFYAYIDKGKREESRKNLIFE